MPKRIVWTAQAKADIRGIEQPLIRLRAQDHRVFFRDRGEYLEISRVRRENWKREIHDERLSLK